MNKGLLIIILSLIIKSSFGQQSGEYFGQTPPGDSAIIFAPGIISRTDRLEAKVAFSQDGNECYFEVVGLVPVVNCKIYYTRRVNNTWTEQAEASFSMNRNVRAPYFSADGKRLYFSFQNTDTTSDIWMVECTTGEWGEPHRLPSPINSPSLEISYTETADSTAYIDSKRPGGFGGFDIYSIRHLSDQSLRVENLGSIVNSTSNDFHPCIAPDGSYLIFSSGRLSREGMAHLYINFNKGNDGWTVPVDMNISGAQINDDRSHHMNPTLSPDGRFLFFARHEKDTIMDIYWVNTKVIADIRKEVFNPKVNK
jgi:Tol biopolymer transport system component